MTHRIHSFLGHSRRSLWLALLAIVCAMPCATTAEELGRLFFTPERRQQLDHQRQFNIEERSKVPEDPTLTINGVVTRSSGKRTVWVNGVPQENSGGVVSPKRSNPGKVVVDTNDVPPTQVSVGDTVNRNTGKTADLLDGGKIKIHPFKP